MSSTKRSFRRWTKDEDELLRQAVAKHSSSTTAPRNSNEQQLNWSSIAACVPNRPAARCRERWCNILDPKVNRGPWTAEEDAIILELYKHQGPNKWVEIARVLNANLNAHRTGDLVKHHAKSMMEFKHSKKRKNQTPPQPKKKTVTRSATAAPARKKSNDESPSSNEEEDDKSLATSWRRQQQLRRTGKWRPSGGWKPPQWAVPQHESAPLAAARSIAKSAAALHAVAPGTAPSEDAIRSSSSSSDMIVNLQDHGDEKDRAKKPKSRTKSKPSSRIVQDLIDKYMPATIANMAQPFAQNQKSKSDDDPLAVSPTADLSVFDATGVGIESLVNHSSTGTTLHSVSVSSVDNDSGSAHSVPASSATTASELAFLDDTDEPTTQPHSVDLKVGDNDNETRPSNIATTTAVSKQGAADESAPLKTMTPYLAFVTPTDDLLASAHAAMSALLPEGDCEELDVVRIAISYYEYWRPQRGETRVILLAESHAFTDSDRALDGPGLGRRFLADSYEGPRDFVSLVYCLAYGEDQALADTLPANATVAAAADSDESKQFSSGKGTPQFWSLLAACSRGTAEPATMSKTNNKTAKSSKFAFAADLLKMGGLSVEERLKSKLKILQDLKKRGIWLLDASLFGWYISQPQKYRRSKATNEVHRCQKERPPKNLKAPALVLAWEMYTKHVVRQVAEEGSLQLLVPIGKEVEAFLSRERLEVAVRVFTKSDDAAPRVAEAFPAPNAWIPGGYGPFFTKLSNIVHEAAPPLSVKSSATTVLDIPPRLCSDAAPQE